MSWSPPPDATVGQRVRARARRDVSLGLIALLVATNVASAYHYARIALADPRDYLAYNGSYGPLAPRVPDAATADETSYGPPQTVFHAGERVGWTTNLCVEPNVTLVGHAELVRTTQSAVPEVVVDRRDSSIPPSMHRCGPRLGSFRFAYDALPGTYEIRRWVDIVPPTGGALEEAVHRVWPLHTYIEPLVVQVVTTINTAPVHAEVANHEDGAP